MANLSNTSDCISYMMYRSGGKQSGDDFATQALLYLNLAYRKIVSGSCELDPLATEDWIWARSRAPKIITLQPLVETGTVNVSNNSTSITFSVAPAASVADWHIKCADHGDVFRISSHTGGNTSATLDSVFTGTSSATSSYKLFKLEYSVGSSDILKILSPMRCYQDSVNRVHGATAEEMERQYPIRDIASGTPTMFAPISESDGTFIVKFNAYPLSDLMRLDFDYTPIPAVLTTSPDVVPIIPVQYRTVLCDFALFLLYNDKNDARSADAFSLAERGYKMMATDHRDRLDAFSDNFGRPIPFNRGQGDVAGNGYGWD